MSKQATQEQIAALTLPATLPGVVRKGTPLSWCGEPCVYLDDASMPDGDAAVFSMKQFCVRNAWLSDCSVDLTDATGRAHLCWAVVAYAKRQSNPSLRWLTALSSASDAPSEQVGWWHYGRARALFARIVGDLSVNDPTRLPDGSRWVDAEALRLVALHVLGGVQ